MQIFTQVETLPNTTLFFIIFLIIRLLSRFTEKLVKYGVT